ncbi:MAG: sugar ABC transporter permease [Anaerolineae bacterium]|nr:sugar ABC transporter permease [Anaerolineae bacterium]
MATITPAANAQPRRATAASTFWQRVVKDFGRNKYIYLMLVPVLLYYIIFHYGPMYGAQIAFRDFVPSKGIWGSEWIGLENFRDFFTSIHFTRLLRNTLGISLMDVFFGFPAPIILAILLNEVTTPWFKRMVQTITYMPFFLSLIVVVGMVIDFLARDGLINTVLSSFGIPPIAWLSNPAHYWGIYVFSGIWQSVGWGSIIYLAAISGIDPSLYEAAKMDGAGRFRQILNITLPGISSTIIVLLILRLGAMMNIGSEKTILLYNALVYDTADIISSYTYRKGILDANYGFSAAVGLFNSVINFVLLLIANTISRRRSETSLF